VIAWFRTYAALYGTEAYCYADSIHGQLSQRRWEQNAQKSKSYIQYCAWQSTNRKGCPTTVATLMDDGKGNIWGTSTFVAKVTLCQPTSKLQYDICLAVKKTTFAYSTCLLKISGLTQEQWEPWNLLATRPRVVARGSWDSRRCPPSQWDFLFDLFVIFSFSFRFRFKNIC